MGVRKEIMDLLSDANCILCGEVKEDRGNALCNKCSPFIYDEKKKPHQRKRLTKEWKINREKRLKKSDYTCEWCEAKPESGLAIHHINSINYYEVWYKMLGRYIRKMIKDNETWKTEWETAWQEDSVAESINKVKREISKKTKGTKVESCPHCDSSSLSKRKQQKPKYYCSNCGKEFSIAKMRSNKKFNFHPKKIDKMAKQLIAQEFEKKIVKHLFPKLKKEYEERVEKKVNRYLGMVNTEVLCKKCHWATENGMKLCPICKKKYYNEIQYESCAKCYKQATVLKVISSKKILIEIEEYLSYDLDSHDFKQLKPLFESFRNEKISGIEFLNQGNGISKSFSDSIFRAHNALKYF